MKSDVNGCSTVPKGIEQYEEFNFNEGQRKPEQIMVQYDYRHPNGTLFSTVAANLTVCRIRRDYWKKKNGYA